MGSNLNKEEIKKIIEEELNEMFNYNISIDDINIDIENEKANVTFGLHIADEDKYIGLSSY